MASFDPKFYADWFVWSEKRAKLMFTKGDVTNFGLFYADVIQTFRLLVAIIQGITEIFKGNVFAIGLRAVTWAGSNPDPLKDVRNWMRDTRVKWGEVPNGR